MVMLLTVSRIALLISGLQHWFIRVNGLPFSQKRNKTILPLVVTTLGKFKWGKMGSGGGRWIRVNRRWEDYGRRERKGREVGVLKIKGTEGEEEKKCF